MSFVDESCTTKRRLRKKTAELGKLKDLNEIFGLPFQQIRPKLQNSVHSRMTHLQYIFVSYTWSLVFGAVTSALLPQVRRDLHPYHFQGPNSLGTSSLSCAVSHTVYCTSSADEHK